MFRHLSLTLRTFIRHPGFAATVVFMLALGIGANTAIFSVVNGVLLRALPYEDAEQLVSIWPDGSLPHGGFLLLQERGQHLESLMGYSFEARYSLTGRDQPLRLRGVDVTAGFFSTLGAQPALGRTFEQGEDQPGSEPTVILSHALFQREFGADPDIIGRVITLDGIDRTVVGVMPASFRFPARDTEVWVPTVIDPSAPFVHWGTFVKAIGRLRPGASAADAQQDLARLMPDIRGGYPWPMPAEYGQAATCVPLQEKMVGGIRLILLLLLAAVGMVLLIACVNIANLLLVRATSRRKEIAIRAALGAGRGQLVRQLLAESLLLGLAGGVCGLAMGFWSLDLLRAHLPTDLPRLDEVSLDASVLLFTLGIALLTGLVFGLVPALRASRPNLDQTLRASSPGAGAGRGHRRLASGLVMAEIALTVVLTIGAGLLIRSFWQLLATDPGFRAENVLAATVAPPDYRYENDGERRLFYDELLARIAALPGVQNVGLATQLPFSGDIFSSAFLIDGRPFPSDGNWPVADAFAVVSADYLQTLGLPLLRGRSFTSADRAEAPGVMIVSQGLARRFWPDEEAVGQRIKLPGQDAPWATVVGVVADAKLGSLSESARPALYQPLQQGLTGPMSLVVRHTAAAETITAQLREVVAAVDADTPIGEIRTLDQSIAASLSKPRITMVLLGTFAGLALLLAAVGIYGVTAHAVNQRRHEIGVRIALGAEPGNVMGLVLKHGLLLAAGGVTIGLALALILTRLVGTLLYGVSTTDLATFSTVPLLLLAVATLASYLPARRAMDVDPMQTLRAE